MNRHFVAACVIVLTTISVVSPDSHANVLGRTTEGTPNVRSINVIKFAPEGVLLIGDGTGAQVFAVQTHDTAAGGQLAEKIEDVGSKLAAKVGTNADGIEIIDLAVNPLSGHAYVAIRKQDDKQYIILTIDSRGKIDEFPLDNVTFARLALNTESRAKVSAVTDVAWADDRVIAAGRSNEEFSSKIFSIDAPLIHDSASASFSAQTYHVSHRKWETRAPMSVVVPIREDGKTWVVGAFSCTPVVKYPIDAVKPGAVVKGESMIELGSGNRPLDMFVYEKDGTPFVLANTFRFHHERRPISPGPYWTVRFEQELLNGTEKTNENAQPRLSGSKPATDRIQMVDAFHGVVHMDKLGDAHALVLRAVGEGFDLEPLALP